MVEVELWSSTERLPPRELVEKQHLGARLMNSELEVLWVKPTPTGFVQTSSVPQCFITVRHTGCCIAKYLESCTSLDSAGENSCEWKQVSRTSPHSAGKTAVCRRAGLPRTTVCWNCRPASCRESLAVPATASEKQSSQRDASDKGSRSPCPGPAGSNRRSRCREACLGNAARSGAAGGPRHPGGCWEPGPCGGKRGRQLRAGPAGRRGNRGGRGGAEPRSCPLGCPRRPAGERSRGGGWCRSTARPPRAAGPPGRRGDVGQEWGLGAWNLPRERSRGSGRGGAGRARGLPRNDHGPQPGEVS